MIILEGIYPNNSGQLDYSKLPIHANDKVSAKYNHDGTFTIYIMKGHNDK